jgi:hypothetical protein
MLAIVKVLVLAMLAVLLLSGAQCFFAASSGSDLSDEDRSELVVIVHAGQLVDDPVQGVQYQSGSLSGLTGPAGEFQFEEGATIRFFIGDIPLGEAVTAKALMSPVDLVPGGTLETPAVINIARLLQSLDAVPGDSRITIPEASLMAASLDDGIIGPVIAQMDFADDIAFVNTATQLIASLTAAYPHTVMLIDAATARERLAISLGQVGVAHSP